MTRIRSKCRYAHILFNIGSIGGLTDGELLGFFASRRDEARELAFATLVERHGPMVLRVCRSILRDEHDAQDAVQATFLVLVRRCGTVRNHASIGSWLHGVALRVAGCARTSAARRCVRERRAAEHAAADFTDDTTEPDLTHVLHEELNRLPERHRLVIVLCYLEGLACEAVASRLGLPVGTVKSRLARGRERLRGQLIRRGLAPSAGLFGAVVFSETAGAALPPRVVQSIARTATGFAAGEEATLGAVSAWVATITGKVLLAMSLRKLARFAGLMLILVATSAGIAAFAQRTSPDPPKTKASKVASAKRPARDDGPGRVRPEPVLEKALLAAEKIPIPWMKAYALADIATAQARLGQAEPSRLTFRRSAEIIEGDRDDASRQITRLAWLAKAQAKAGDRAGTRATIARIHQLGALVDDVASRRSAFYAAARWQADAGNAEGTIDFLQAMKDANASTKAYVLAVAAGEQAKAGDIPGARVTMARADADAERAEKEPPEKGADPAHALDAMRLAQVRGMAPFAAAEAKAGDVKGAHATLTLARAAADRVRDVWRSEPLAQIAMAYKAAGDEDAADEALKSALLIALGLPEPAERIEALARVAIAQADSGDRKAGRETLDQAVWIASQVPSVPGGGTDQTVSAAKARVGDWTGGRQSALGQTDNALRATHVEGVCFFQAKAGEARDAVEWADGQTDPLLRAHALLGAVRGMIE